MSMSSRSLVLLLVSGLLGCLPDASGYVAEGTDGGFVGRDAPGEDAPGRDAPGQDAPGRDAPGEDSGTPDDCQLPVTCAGGACPTPWLIASVEDLPGGQSCGGQVLRFSLSASGICRCGGLDAEGNLPDLPFAVGFSPPTTVVVAAEDDAVVGLNGLSDRFLWSVPNEGQPSDIFPIHQPGPDGSPRIAVANRRRGFSAIQSIQIYEPITGGLRVSVEPREFGASNISSATLNPLDRAQLRAVKPSAYAAGDADPWTGGSMVTMPYHTLDREGFFLTTISSFFFNGNYRVVWTGIRSERSEVFSYRSVVPRTENTLGPGGRCDLEATTRLDYDLRCAFWAAVPDPFDDTSSFAICRDGAVSRLVHLESSDNTCTTIVEGSELFESGRISDVSVALDHYWPGL